MSKASTRLRHERCMKAWLVALFVLLVAGCRSNPEAQPVVAGPFAWLVGDWRGVRRDGADGTAARMRLRVQPVLGGAGQLEELQVEHPRGTYRGLHVRLRERESGRWVSEYANATRGEFTKLEGELGAGDESSWRSVEPGRTRETWLEYERPEPDRWIRTQRLSEDGGLTWSVLFTDELERVDG